MRVWKIANHTCCFLLGTVNGKKLWLQLCPIYSKLIDAPRDKTNKMACAPSEVSDQPGHPPSLIRVFAARMKKAWVLSYPLSAQRKLWSDWADAQADLSLRWAHSHFVGFVTRRLNCESWTDSTDWFTTTKVFVKKKKKKEKRKKKKKKDGGFFPLFSERLYFSIIYRSYPINILLVLTFAIHPCKYMLLLFFSGKKNELKFSYLQPCFWYASDLNTWKIHGLPHWHFDHDIKFYSSLHGDTNMNLLQNKS